MSDKVTVPAILQRKRAGERVAMVTCYDYATALLLDRAGVDILLVGDSLGNTVLGFEDPIPVTMDDMVRHTAAVRRGTQRALIVADMPFLSASLSPEEALRNAGRLVQQGGAHAVKIEGGVAAADTIRRVVEAGIPVMGHIGLTPQSVHTFGGYRIQGRDEAGAARLRADAAAVESAGAFGVVLELMPVDVAQAVTADLSIPTIGIGAGPRCDGQVQVFHDLLGLFPDRQYRHARRYADVGETIVEAARRYAEDVRSGSFTTVPAGAWPERQPPVR